MQQIDKHEQSKPIINFKNNIKMNIRRMKSIVITAFFLFIITGTAWAQAIVDEVAITTTKEYEVNQYESMIVKTTEAQERILRFDPRDKGKLNQNLVDAPVLVEKTIWIDDNNDQIFDKEITLSYKKDINENLLYQVTPEGVYITTKDRNRLLFSQEGSYDIETKQVDVLTIAVDELPKKK